MKKNKFILLIAALSVILLQSCTSYRSAVPMTPVTAQLNFDMDDLEYLGEVTGSNSQAYILGIVPYGGRKYHRGALIPQGLFGISIPGNRGYNNAIYDALQQRKDADLVLPIAFETVTNHQFLGRRVLLTVRFKAYRFKTR